MHFSLKLTIYHIQRKLSHSKKEKTSKFDTIQNSLKSLIRKLATSAKIVLKILKMSTLGKCISVESSLAFSLTLCLPVSYADNLGKQFGPRSGLMNRRA